MHTLSRYREYAADRGAALLTGDPALLASALVRIHGGMGHITRKDLRRAQAVSSAFYISLPGRSSWVELFSTHPTLEHRVEALRKIQEQMAAAQAH